MTVREICSRLDFLFYVNAEWAFDEYQRLSDELYCLSPVVHGLLMDSHASIN